MQLEKLPVSDRKINPEVRKPFTAYDHVVIPKGCDTEGYSDESMVINLQGQANIISYLRMTSAVVACN